MSQGKKVRTVSVHERIKRGIQSRTWIPWDESKEALKNTTVHSWTHFYHKPYQFDWLEAHNKAIERKWRYEGNAEVAQNE